MGWVSARGIGCQRLALARVVQYALQDVDSLLGGLVFSASVASGARGPRAPAVRRQSVGEGVGWPRPMLFKGREMPLLLDAVGRWVARAALGALLQSMGQPSHAPDEAFPCRRQPREGRPGARCEFLKYTRASSKSGGPTEWGLVWYGMVGYGVAWYGMVWSCIPHFSQLCYIASYCMFFKLFKLSNVGTCKEIPWFQTFKLFKLSNFSSFSNFLIKPPGHGITSTLILLKLPLLQRVIIMFGGPPGTVPPPSWCPNGNEWARPERPGRALRQAPDEFLRPDAHGGGGNQAQLHRALDGPTCGEGQGSDGSLQRADEGRVQAQHGSTPRICSAEVPERHRGDPGHPGAREADPYRVRTDRKWRSRWRCRASRSRSATPRWAHSSAIRSTSPTSGTR